MIAPFHLAVPVDDIGRARAFYGGVLGLPEGRSAERTGTCSVTSS